ncbi:LysR family transcriptional regulator [Stappia sp. BW2]|uniref:LysR family transcriptional regulator n=1 Tax=Stappia sp. BW2 TaxID=2592622 RepID=UPI0011DE67CD|nr:LysR family transcriptional regulator [Stappia sp. BW2]TYC75751.1 LysR family transcriptional regulator [Stappia sp. BW2]
MDIRFLESLLAVAETGSIAAAARQQGLTAAAVSQRIRVLEAEFGAALLNRTAHAALPTETCFRLLPAARRLVRDAQKLTSDIDATGLSGPFRLGAVSTALSDTVPVVIQQFRVKAPQAVLTVRPGTSADLYEGLRSGGLDAVIAVAAPFDLPKDIISRTLEVQTAVHALPPGRDTSAPAEDLPWIVYDRQSWGGRKLWSNFGGLVGEEHILCELDAPETIAQMVSQGAGQAILPVWQGLRMHGPAMTLKDLPGGTGRKMVFLRKHACAAPVLADLVHEVLRQQVVT